jgi:hypothetical protein
MTKQEVYIKHWQMWDELVKHPGLEKIETQAYLEYVKKAADEPMGDCFLCESNNMWCSECPLFKQAGAACHDPNWFDFWVTAQDKKDDAQTIKYATLIRDCVIPYLTKESKKKLGLEV